MFRAILIVMWGLLVGGVGQSSILVTVSVDWEGRVIDSYDITKMQRFRQALPDVPLLHFLNAAYYTKPGADAVSITKTIRSVLRPQDEIGLHIHGWKSLVEDSGVEFKSGPSWSPWAESCSVDCGHSVPLWAYGKEQLVRIIKRSHQILVAQGFTQPISFRAGGWMASQRVIDALVATGFHYDSSAVPTHHFRDRLSGYKLPSWIKEIWGQLPVTAQPYRHRGLWEMPDNGCLADYMTDLEMLKVFDANVALWRQDPDQDVYVHFGFHQETASNYIHRVESAIRQIQTVARTQQLPVEFVTFSQIRF